MAFYRIYDNDGGLERFLNGTVLPDNVVTLNTTTVVITGGGYTISYHGSFNVIGGRISSGQVQAFEVDYLGAHIFEMSDIDIDVLRIAANPNDLDRLALAGDDLIQSDWKMGATFLGYDGDDRFELGTGDDIVDGGNGQDTFFIQDSIRNVRLESSFGTVTVNSSQGRDIAVGVEIFEFLDAKYRLVLGTSSSETLPSGTLPEDARRLVLANDGNDTVEGGRRGDALFGKSGNDMLKGRGGDDLIAGGHGKDELNGNKRDDLLNGGSGGDVLRGGAGDDELIGARGFDKLFGGAGRDALAGGIGNDRLHGGKGDDLLTGGDGDDLFVFARRHGADIVTDFTPGQDKLRFVGTTSLDDLDFARRGGDVELTHGDTVVLFEDITRAELRDADNFLF